MKDLQAIQKPCLIYVKARKLEQIPFLIKTNFNDKKINFFQYEMRLLSKGDALSYKLS